MTDSAGPHPPIISESKVNDPCVSIRVLLGSTCTYTVAKISDTKCRFAYAMAMSRCYAICSEKRSKDDVYLMRQELIHLKSELPAYLPKRSWFNRENYYTVLAVDHAIGVVESILVRFVRGYSNEDEALVRNILEGDADGHQVHSYLERLSKIEG